MADWPTEPADIVREALRDYVGDGEGADEAVLAAYETEIAARALNEAAEDWWEPHDREHDSASRWLEERAARLRGADRG